MFTRHNLTARRIKNKTQFNNLTETLKKLDLIGYAFDNGEYSEKNHEAIFHSYDCVKWNKRPENMVSVAEAFPNIYFELECKDEQNDMFWKEYYHDMDIETCQGEIIYEQPRKVQWTQLIVI